MADIDPDNLAATLAETGRPLSTGGMGRCNTGHSQSSIPSQVFENGAGGHASPRNRVIRIHILAIHRLLKGAIAVAFLPTHDSAGDGRRTGPDRRRPRRCPLQSPLSAPPPRVLGLG